MGKKLASLRPPRFDEYFLFATGAATKLADFQYIADYVSRTDVRNGKSPLKVGFSFLDEWTPYHAAVEDGLTGRENVRRKAEEAAEDFDHLRPGHSLHDQLLAKLARENPIEHDPKRINQALSHIRLFTEDTTSSLPFDIWVNAAKKIATPLKEGGLNVDPNLIYVADGTAIKGKVRKKDGKDYITIADIGPILKAAGPHAFFEALRQSAVELGYKEIPYMVHCDCAIARLSDAKEDSFIEFKAEKELRIFLPQGINNPIPKSSDAITTSDHYLATIEKPKQCLADDLGEYIAKDSPRRMVFDQLMVHLREKRTLENNEHLTIAESHKPQVAYDNSSVNKKPKLKIARLTPIPTGWDLTNIAGNPIKTIAPNGSDFIHHIGGEFKFKLNKAKKYYHPDIVILPPFDPNDPVARIHATQAFLDITTAKQIDQRFYPVLVVVQNLNGCYDELMSLHTSFIDMGYCGDYKRHPFYDGRSARNPLVRVPGVSHTVTGMLHEVSGSSMRSLDMATLQIADAHIPDYIRNHEKPRLDGELKLNGIDFSDVFGVGYFSSASSQKRQSLESAGSYGKFLADNDLALYTGGGDQYLMYAPVESYLANGGRYLGVCSTFRLVAKETAGGRLPPAQLSQLTRAIGSRIVLNLLPRPKLYLAWDGGRGTGQEISSFLSAQYLRPELVDGKYLCIFDPYADDSKNSIQKLQVEAMMGRGSYNKMLHDHDAFAETHRVRFATELPEVKSITLQARDGFVNNSQRNSRTLISAYG